MKLTKLEVFFWPWPPPLGRRIRILNAKDAGLPASEQGNILKIINKIHLCCSNYDFYVEVTVPARVRSWGLKFDDRNKTWEYV